METLFQSKHKLTLASWNVNSIRARLPLVLDWLSGHKPDIICLQETKCEDKDFPFEAIEELSYNVAHFGQKTFNGVAILSKLPLDDIQKGLPGFEDEQCRFIEAGVNVGKHYLRVASVYVPNGQEVGSDKYHYKLRFLESLHGHMQSHFAAQETCLFAGDYNIAPTDLDVHDAAAWHEQILCSTPERQAFQRLANIGYTDVLGFENPRPFTWWDYRAGAFQRNNGLRIDHILASPFAADKVSSAYVDRDVRSLEKASDHAPVILKMEF